MLEPQGIAPIWLVTCRVDLHASKSRVTSALNQEVTGVVY
jgi:hypothetical protein